VSSRGSAITRESDRQPICTAPLYDRIVMKEAETTGTAAHERENRSEKRK
jgi:hypothetical protein